MSKEYEFRRLSPDNLRAALDVLGLSPAEFAEITGTKRATVSRWLRDTDDPEHLDPPFWVSQLLGLAALPGAMERLRTVANLHREEIARNARS